MLNGSAMMRLGPIQVRLSGTVKVDADGREIASVSAPTPAEATAALTRTARVNGADGVIAVGSDYRRMTIARGPLSTQTLIEVQAWGTAVARDPREPRA